MKNTSQLSQQEKNKSYIHAHMWNLEQWYRCSYLQTRNRDTDVENKFMNTKGGKQVVGWTGKLVLTSMHRGYVCTKSLQLYPALCDSVDCSPPGFSVHGDSLGKNTGVDCHFLLQEGWAPKNWCFWIVVFEKPLESSLDSKGIKPVNLKGS